MIVKYLESDTFTMTKLASSYVTVMVIAALGALDCCSGQRTDLSFSISTQHWDKDKFIFVGDDVKLLCTTNTASSTIEILRSDDGKQLVSSHGRELSLEYTITEVECNDAGTYVCVVDNVWNKTLEIGVHDCPPRPCEASDVNKTIFVRLHQTVQFSLCVLAYPDIQEVIQFNNTLIRQKHSTDWTWDYEKRPLNIGASQIHINVSSVTMVSELYGVLNIRVFSRSGLQFYLDYNIFIQHPVAPECPREVIVSDEGQSYIRLTWTPGSDGGANKDFRVYSSEDNVTWNKHNVAHGETTLNVSDLQENISYCFRVASSNDVRPDPNEFVCQNTICGHTHYSIIQQSTSSVNLPEHIYIITTVCAVIVVLSVLLIAVLCRMKVRPVADDEHYNTGNNQREEHLEASTGSPPGGQQSDSGHYISREGLTYITVSHVMGVRKAKRKRRKEKKEKIVYATLDYSKTGKAPLSHS